MSSETPPPELTTEAQRRAKLDAEETAKRLDSRVAKNAADGAKKKKKKNDDDDEEEENANDDRDDRAEEEEESDSSDDEENDELEWDLGFLEPISSKKRMHAIYFPSKVGGTPEWLDPRVTPKAIPDVVEGESGCNDKGEQGAQKTMDFLLQIYAVNDDNEDEDVNANAFHRTLYVFASARGDKLHEKGRVRAFRSQLPRENGFYGMNPAPAENAEENPRVDELIREHEAKKLAIETAAKARVNGGSEGTKTKANANDNTVYPEFEIVVEPESDDDDASCSSMDSDAVTDAKKNKNDTESANKKKMFQSIGDEAITESDLKEIASGVIDADAQRLATFSVKLSKFPDQVLRYCPAPNAKAMWPSKSLAPDDRSIPDCPRCNSKRRFEFQILPTIVSFLVPKESVELNDTSLDFGSIAVYTCSKSCALDGEYAEEYVLVHPPMNS